MRFKKREGLVEGDQELTFPGNLAPSSISERKTKTIEIVKVVIAV